MANVEWKPIEDLPANWQDLAAPDLESLGLIWREQSQKLHDSDALRQFNERLSREWAIETGIIENIYSIDRGTTQLLIEKGIETALIPYGTTDKPAEKIVPIIRAQEEALEGLFSFVKQESELSNFYIRQLHQVLTRNQPTATALDQFGNVMEVELLHGQWKKTPNNPTRPDGNVHFYAPPEQVQTEMDRLMELHNEHLRQNVPAEVEAAWLHHRFTQIHPFQDGNGRVARSLATLVLLRAGLFPLVVTRDERSDYIAALEKADNGDLTPLVRLFAELEKKAIIRALSLSEDIIDEQTSLQEAIAAIEYHLSLKTQANTSHLEEATELAKYLESIVQKEFEQVANSLNKVFRSINQNFIAEPKRNDYFAGYAYYVGTSIEKLAKMLQYTPNLEVYCTVTGLSIKQDTQDLSDLLVSFHGLGDDFVGVMVASAFTLTPGGGPKVLKPYSEPVSVIGEVFEFSYSENKQVLVKRFQSWLNALSLEALKLWRKQIF